MSMLKPRDSAYLLARFRECLRSPNLDSEKVYLEEEAALKLKYKPKDAKQESLLKEAVEQAFLEAVRSVPASSVEVATVANFLDARETPAV